MHKTDISTKAQTHIWPASGQVAEHVLMYVVRDTRGSGLDGPDQLNHFPASPFCCITWMLEGELALVQQGKAERDQRLPQIFLAGCQSQYGISGNIGERHSFMAVFYADAFHALFELDLSIVQDLFVDARTSLNLQGRALLEAVALARDDAERCQLIESHVAQYASPLFANPWSRLRKMGQNLSLRLSCSLLGVGERQVQRRARKEAGLPLLGLSRLWRAKRSHSQVLLGLGQGHTPNWAEHASTQGYADQSHLIRDCKDISGRSPQQLLNDARNRESDWMYRL
ncbi:helix-turn-helix domain-containing protein [Undibacterium sp. CY18W]|uniref:Helix-turn-helix domain-containing protein n=1 Tax=Undibacterium hunanense TaxID=2762292 RepID=A0ABR6ZSH5_9BURK|nr:helix-turn-helix domain-containing protein [Undibacterium hunanense]MBC3918853.1 helix-turn-helix domain-containing protein [Undibacterium hunanense]